MKRRDPAIATVERYLARLEARDNYLQKTGYRVNRAAAIAEVEETTFRRWMRFHGIRVSRPRSFETVKP